MAAPEYAGSNVVDGYVLFAGLHQGNMHFASTSTAPVDMAGHTLAEGCRLIALQPNNQHAEHAGHRAFRAAKRMLAPLVHPASNDPLQEDAGLLDITATTLVQRHQTGVQSRARSRLLECASGIITNRASAITHGPGKLARAKWEGVRGRHVGRITEMAALGGLAFACEDSVLTLAALPDHEHLSTIGASSHFDLTVSFAANGVPAHTRKVQVKTECLGFGGHRRTDSARKMLAHYNNDILLVSGCCDLGIHVGHGVRDLAISRLLVRLASNEGSCGDRQRVADIGGRLLETIREGGEGRWGRKRKG